jgi:hypothetical protein
VHLLNFHFAYTVKGTKCSEVPIFIRETNSTVTFLHENENIFGQSHGFSWIELLSHFPLPPANTGKGVTFFSFSFSLSSVCAIGGRGLLADGKVGWRHFTSILKGKES